MTPRTLARLDELVFRCPECDAWRLPDYFMRRDHRCIPEIPIN